MNDLRYHFNDNLRIIHAYSPLYGGTAFNAVHLRNGLVDILKDEIGLVLHEDFKDQIVPPPKSNIGAGGMYDIKIFFTNSESYCLAKMALM